MHVWLRSLAPSLWGPSDKFGNCSLVIIALALLEASPLQDGLQLDGAVDVLCSQNIQNSLHAPPAGQQLRNDTFLTCTT